MNRRTVDAGAAVSSLAAGALFAGVVFARLLHRRGRRASSGRASLFTLPDNHILHEMHDVPVWVELAPFVAMVARLRASPS